MVQKIKFIILFLISLVLCFLSFKAESRVEVNLLKTLLPKSIVNSDDIILTTNKSSSIIKVVFEGDSEENIDATIDLFLKEVDGEYFEYNKPDFSKLLEKYLSKPYNFLSDNTKNLLKNKKYDEIYNNSINMLYSPIGIQLSSIDKDPYLFLDDFILSNKKISPKNNYIEGKYYDFLMLKIKDEEGLSPDLSNKKIKELINLKNKLSNKNSKIYLAGVPIHSYYTSITAVVSINVICILSTILIIFLTYFYFRTLKILIPIALSIIFGMLTGFCAVKLWFSDFQIITMVFSATLIGIGIDYSYHYFFSNKNRAFSKNLTFSFITSIIPFVLLYLTNIELLQQVSVFTVFGLFGIYCVVLFVYPCFKIDSPQISTKLNNKFYKISLIIILILSISGFLRFNFNDTLTALYSPSNKLKRAEVLYSKISNENFENAKIITIKGNDFNNLIEKEEKITTILRKNNVEYMALSKLLPSKNVQKENFELVEKLYENNLDNYKNILSSNQIKSLKNLKFSLVEFNIDDYPFLKDFRPNDNTSLIFVLDGKKLNLEDKNINIIDFKTDVKNCMEKYRKMLILILPLTILILAILLAFLYNYKKAFIMLLPTLVGIYCAVGMTSLIEGEINLFSVIAIFLLIGFTMDYSIFRENKEKRVEDAILISCATTSFSFLLLSFCGFKLLSSISLVLFFGIITSYISGKLIFKNKKQ